VLKVSFGARDPLVREYVYLYGAVSPKDGTCVYLIMPVPDTQCFQIFLETLAKKYPRQLILLFVDGAGNHQSDELDVPANIILHFLPPYSPELNPQENLWDEIREKIFKNYALKSIDEVYAKLEEAALYIERNPGSSNLSRRSPTSQSQSDMEAV
jgi:DDE superfamily endonuclease